MNRVGNTHKTKVYSLVCKRDAKLGLCCLSSLVHGSFEPIQLVLVNDGSLNEEDKKCFLSQISAACFVEKNEIADMVSQQYLSGHPATRNFLRNNVFGFKLIALPLLVGKQRLNYIDSDICFFSKFQGLFPPEDSEAIIFMADDAHPKSPEQKMGAGSRLAKFFRHCAGGGYSAGLFRLHLRHRIKLAKNLNAGLYSIPAKFFDLDFVEWFLSQKKLHLFPHLVEQTCWAAMAGTKRFSYWSKNQFFCSERDLPRESPLAVHFITRHKKNALGYIGQTQHETLRYTPVTFEQGQKITPLDIAAQISRKAFAKVARG